MPKKKTTPAAARPVGGALYLGRTVVHQVTRFHELGMHALTNCGRLIELDDERYVDPQQAAIPPRIAAKIERRPACRFCQTGPRSRTRRFDGNRSAKPRKSRALAKKIQVT